MRSPEVHFLCSDASAVKAGEVYEHDLEDLLLSIQRTLIRRRGVREPLSCRALLSGRLGCPELPARTLHSQSCLPAIIILHPGLLPSQVILIHLWPLRLTYFHYPPTIWIGSMVEKPEGGRLCLRIMMLMSW